MNKEFKSKILMLIIAGTLVFSFSACIRSADIHLGGNPPVKKKKGRPPHHAPAHGYRAKYIYYYYPAAQVYFDTGRRVYFYMDGPSWRMTVSLPPHIRIALGERVTIEMDSDKPYKKHKIHKKKYPPGHFKKGKGKKKTWFPG
ncbi:MAG: hypothetical protein JRJ31_11805 [Deltaproteobacteria bacterium]|nr:hypothetical protein [Deltaproteobacteria bacterium]